MPRLPLSLFKYRSFETNTLRLLAHGEIYLAPPSTFNDPFDCDPVIQPDAEMGQLEHLWKVLALRATGKKDAATAKARVARELAEYRHLATRKGGTHDDGSGSQDYRWYLSRDVRTYVVRLFAEHGVLSLSARWDSPLMWSHFASEHRGLCIEYSTDDHRCAFLQPVNYSLSRYMDVNALHQWLVGRSADAKARIFDQYFLAKAGQWRYEKELRAVQAPAGRAHRPFRIASVLFGLRADPTIVTTTAKLLAGYAPQVKFYQIHATDDGFKLDRHEIDEADVKSFGVRESTLFDLDDFGME